MCVSLKHGLVIVSAKPDHSSGGAELHMHSLADGSLVRSIGSKGSGKGQFNWYHGGLCVSPDGDSVLVAEFWNHRVQVVSIADGSWVRFVGEGVLDGPEFVDCNADVVAVSEPRHRVSVLSWHDGTVLAQFGRPGSGPGQLYYPRGARLLADGSGVVVTDCHNHRLCVFDLSGEFVRTMGSREQGLTYPYDVLECASDDSFIVTNTRAHTLVKVSNTGDVFKPYRIPADNPWAVGLSTMASLPNGGLAVVSTGQIILFQGFDLRHAWVSACVMYSVRGVSVSVSV